MKTIYRLEDISSLEDYEQQADEFLRLTKSTLQTRYKKTALYFGDKKDRRDIYEVELTRGERTFPFTFGDSLHNTWKRIATCTNGSGNERTAKYLLDLWESNSGSSEARMSKMRYTKENEKLKTWDYHSAKPTGYSILAGLQAHEPPQTFDDFIAEFGYEITSKESYEQTQETFEAVKDEYDNLKMLYTDRELSALAEIA